MQHQTKAKTCPGHIASLHVQAFRTQAHVTDWRLPLSIKCSKCCPAHHRYCSVWLKVMWDIFLMLKHFLISSLICRGNCKPLLGWFQGVLINLESYPAFPIIWKAVALLVYAWMLLPLLQFQKDVLSQSPEPYMPLIILYLPPCNRQGKHKSVSCC